MDSVTHEVRADDTPHRCPFDIADIDGILHFCESHPTTTDGSGLLLLNSLLTGLPSGPEYVVDIRLQGERALVAVVIDTLTSAADTGLIIVFGLRQGPHSERVLDFSLDAAETIVQAGSASLIEVQLPKPIEHHAPVLQARGYKLASREYRMVRPHAGPVTPLPQLASQWRFIDADLAHVPEYHALVTRAFTGLPGYKICSLKYFRDMFLRTKRRPRLLLNGDRIAGFIKTALDSDGETGHVELIGRHPALHGQGLGVHLLAEAVRILAGDGARRLRLEVSALNRSALALYLCHGFTVEADEPTYSKPVVR
jgi:ribosomal protein S18 acetylase RimI-like enzyme